MVMEDFLQSSSWSVSAWELEAGVERCWGTWNGFGDRQTEGQLYRARTQYYTTQPIIVKVDEIKRQKDSEAEI